MANWEDNCTSQTKLDYCHKADMAHGQIMASYNPNVTQFNIFQDTSLIVGVKWNWDRHIWNTICLNPNVVLCLLWRTADEGVTGVRDWDKYYISLQGVQISPESQLFHWLSPNLQWRYCLNPIIPSLITSQKNPSFPYLLMSVIYLALHHL